MKNFALRIALAADPRPIYRIAVEADGMHPSKVSKIVGGYARATPAEQRALAKVLGRRVEDLFAGEGQERGLISNTSMR